MADTQSSPCIGGYVRRFPGSLSLNAAIFASVMLASRLQSLLDVFAFLAFAMEWFAVFPMFRQRLKVRRRRSTQRSHCGPSRTQG